MPGFANSKMVRIIERPQPSVALVIATFAAVPYVHLALESRRRYYPWVPVLVNDDGSPAASELRNLCHGYGAEFRSNSRRLRRTVGDLSSYLHGLQWPAALGVDLVVKMSRRFIALHNWVPTLQAIAWESQYATYSQQCLHFNFGFRTECIGLHAASWRSPTVLRELQERVEQNQPVFVEGYLHQLARQLQGFSCAQNRQYHIQNPRPADSDAYGIWPIMSDRRTTKKPDILWHDCDSPADYCRVANLFDLKYSLDDFIDPNQGQGLGQP